MSDYRLLGASGYTEQSLTITCILYSDKNLSNLKFFGLSSDTAIMSLPTVFVLSVRLSVRHTVCQRNSSETTEQNFMKLGR